MPVHVMRVTSSFKANAATSWSQSRWASHGRRRSTAGSCWIKLWRLFVSLSVTKLVQTIRTFSVSSQLLVFPYCPYIVHIFPMQYLAAFHLLPSRPVRLGDARTRRQAQWEVLASGTCQKHCYGMLTRKAGWLWVTMDDYGWLLIK